MLDQSKAYLLEARLAGLVAELQCASFNELYYKAKADASGKIRNAIIDAVSTKETLFFRDASPFELLQHKILPELIDRRLGRQGIPGSKDIRIWSAACSTGQEVYSIAMVIQDLLPDWSRYNIKILGTDISDEAISRASYGRYNKFEIERGLPKEKLKKYFLPLSDNGWKVKDDLRSLATFKKLNLLENLVGLGRFDVIFCRNVAIYFSSTDKVSLFQRLAEILEPNGYLIIGSTESLLGVSPLFEGKKHLRSVFYQLKQSPQVATPEIKPAFPGRIALVNQ